MISTVLFTSFLCAAPAAGASPNIVLITAGSERAPDFTITDKTLVAWAYLSSTTQRAGSVLTVIDDAEHFDALVYAERAPTRWMAGSDFFRRTPADQSAYPQETADEKTLVQIAATYDKNTITLYRNGSVFARYTIDRPQSFDQDMTVLIGLRYVGGQGKVGFFAGAIEEARLYDVPLDTATIAGLRPTTPSEPKPIGQWTFEDGTVSDARGRFPPGKLRGSAHIERGRLLLDGTTAYAEIARPRTTAPQSMFYRPRLRETGRMWDTWLYLHQGTYYLYYLANQSRSWDNISLATSPDGIVWREQGSLLSKGAGVTWMGTGSTWRSPVDVPDRRYVMNFSEWRGPRQTIFFARSTDLVTWQRLPDSYEFKQDTRWYEPNGRWDCIYTIPRPGGGLFGYWTATAKAETGGRFGFGQSLDGVTWEALPPPKTPGVGKGEAGAVEKIGENYYMMFGTGGIMVTLVADKPQGPFLPAKKNYRLLSGHTYFSRFFPTPDGVLVNHHAISRSGPVYFAPLKATVLDGEGTLRLGWWHRNEKLKHESVPVKQPATQRGAIALIQNAFDVKRGTILEGQILLPPAKDTQRRGFYIACGADHGAAILLDAQGVAELGPMRADGGGFKVDKRVDREMAFGAPASFRLLLKESLLELYLDDILIECFSLPKTATGRIGLIRGSDRASTTRVKAWRAP